MTLELVDRLVFPAEPELVSCPSSDSGLSRIALLGNFLPRRCGIATFTGDIHTAISTRFPNVDVDVYAMDDRPGAYAYPGPVVAGIAADDIAAYRVAAHRINGSGADLLWIQHEYGIFGGEAGQHLLALLDALEIPFVATLHTVLADPTPEQRRVMDALVRSAARLFPMAERGRELLIELYGARSAQVRVIPHGVPDRPLGRTEAWKARLGFEGHKVLLTFGLLSPGKGIETMIRAMPEIIGRHPEALYVILGATHPNLIAREGEAYREGLVALSERLGVANHVRWIDEFLETGDLLDFIEASDIYVTPYLGESQMTSGTLAYAVALGKPVVSTPYIHAAELLGSDHGALVDFDDSAGFAREILALLGDLAERNRIGRNNHALGRHMLWPRLAETAMAEMVAAVEEARFELPSPYDLPPLAAFAAVARLSDDTGIVQHSKFGVPDRAHGYCVDDNARALILMQRAEDLPDSHYDRWTPVYAAFVDHAWNPGADRFRNFMSFDRRWLEEAGSEDSSARTLWSVAVTARDGRSADLREWAANLFDRALPHAFALASPRSAAFAALGAAAMLEARPAHEGARRLLADRGEALAEALATYRQPDWTWFEPVLAYDNARLPEALLAAGAALARPEWVAGALASLAWLNHVQRAPAGHFRPVGTASFGLRHAPPAPFDQQPVDAWATIDACAAAYAIEADRSWIDAALSAWRWFEGENDGGVTVADPATGECRDGLGPHGLNFNRGAESVLAYQLANRTIRALLDA